MSKCLKIKSTQQQSWPGRGKTSTLTCSPLYRLQKLHFTSLFLPLFPEHTSPLLSCNCCRHGDDRPTCQSEGVSRTDTVGTIHAHHHLTPPFAWVVWLGGYVHADLPHSQARVCVCWGRWCGPIKHIIYSRYSSELHPILIRPERKWRTSIVNGPCEAACLPTKQSGNF